MQLQGKVAIVTGAAAGFGESIARRFAREGAAVIVIDRDAGRGKAVADDISASGARAAFLEADLLQVSQIAPAIDAAAKIFGRLDILVNNAGVPQRPTPVAAVTEADFDRIFAVNVRSLHFAIAAAASHLRKQGGGAIVNVSSIAGSRPRPNLVVYGASKAAVTALTYGYALELAADKIRVCSVAPVAGDTGMLVDFMGGVDSQDIRKSYVAGIPLGRLCQPVDVASAVLFLASDEASFITGTELRVDGGRGV